MSCAFHHSLKKQEANSKMILESKTYIKDQEPKKKGGGSRIGQKKTVELFCKPHIDLAQRTSPRANNVTPPEAEMTHLYTLTEPQNAGLTQKAMILLKAAPAPRQESSSMKWGLGYGTPCLHQHWTHLNSKQQREPFLK